MARQGRSQTLTAPAQPYQRGFASRTSVSETARTFLRAVHLWMFLGLLVTAGVSYLMVAGGLIRSLSIQTLIGLVIGELVLVFFLAARAHALPPAIAGILFFVYAGLNGVTLSPIFLIYTSQSLTNVFLITSVMFGGMSLFGFVTQRSLASWGSFLLMGLLGLITASIVGIFAPSPMLSIGIGFFGVLVFTLLVAYDTQMLVEMAEAGETSQGHAINGALALYLDFINLFLFLLRLFGSRD